MTIIAVIGSKKSGKTTTIEALVKGLTKRGHRVATIKHVPEKGFTIDREGKDTWRHAKAGAQTVMVVAPKELAIIEKTDTAKLGLREIIDKCPNDTDIIILEGFRNLVESKPRVHKIVVVRTSEEAIEALKRFKPIIAFTGATSIQKKIGITVIDVLKDPERLVDIVERTLHTHVQGSFW